MVVWIIRCFSPIFFYRFKDNCDIKTINVIKSSFKLIAYPSCLSHSKTIPLSVFGRPQKSIPRQRNFHTNTRARKAPGVSLERNGIYQHQSDAIIINMADFSNTDKEEVVSKGIAKRKYLLIDDDLEGLDFTLKDNPVNKSYG